MPEPLRVGLIGTGRMGRAHLLAYLQFPDKVKLTAVCDLYEDVVQQYAKDAGVDKVYTDAAKMIKDADIDAVDICTIHDVHLPQVLAAAWAGKHVLTEKAMGRTMDECCQTGKEPISSGSDNLGTIKTVLGMYESARTGRAVDLATL